MPIRIGGLIWQIQISWQIQDFYVFVRFVFVRFWHPTLVPVTGSSSYVPLCQECIWHIILLVIINVRCHDVVFYHKLVYSCVKLSNTPSKRKCFANDSELTSIGCRRCSWSQVSACSDYLLPPSDIIPISVAKSPPLALYPSGTNTAPHPHPTPTPHPHPHPTPHPLPGSQLPSVASHSGPLQHRPPPYRPSPLRPPSTPAHSHNSTPATPAPCIRLPVPHRPPR